MIESDYIMRMINQLTQAIINLFKLKAAKDYPLAFAEVDRACKHLLGVDLAFLDSFSDRQLVEFFGKDPEFAASRWYVIGILLKERGELERLSGATDKAIASDERALSLLLEAYFDAGPVVQKDHLESLEALIGRCREVGFSRDLLLKVARYYEAAGRLEQAEDLMLDLLYAFPEDAGLVKAFYRRALEKSDEQLERGGLPRARILQQVENL